MCLLCVNLVIEHVFKQTICISCFTKINLCCFTTRPLEKSDIMCGIIYWYELGNIWYLRSDLSRHTMLAMSLRFILVVS